MACTVLVRPPKGHLRNGVTAAVLSKTLRYARLRRPTLPVILAMALMLALLLTVTLAEAQTPGNVDYDTDNDGLIEVSNLAQLDGIRHDLDGDGVADYHTDGRVYIDAFPGAPAGMGCPDAGCTGYELVADLDFDTNGNGQADAGDAWWNNGAGWVPIGRAIYSYPFNANFDGGNHTIANLYINWDYEFGGYVGLFGAIVSPNSTIKRIGLTSVSVTCSGECQAGGLAGDVGGYTITDSYVTGSVSVINCNSGIICYVGGLAGSLSGTTITDSYATGDVNITCDGDVSCWAGGLAGNVGGGEIAREDIEVSITASYASANVSATCLGADVSCNVGGLTGVLLPGGSIAASHATGRVSASCDGVEAHCDAGGLVGSAEGDGPIAASHATGRVSASCDGVEAHCRAGGLVGDNSRGVPIAASHAIGDVSATCDGDGTNCDAGGLIGYSSGVPIAASHAGGDVSATCGDAICHAGGLLGAIADGSSITASYAISNVSATCNGPHDFCEAGGLVGVKYSGRITIAVSYWDTQTSDQAIWVGRSSDSDFDAAGIAGKATAELQAPTGYTGIYADWNVDLDNADGDDDPTTGGDDPWDFGASSHYPTLKYVGPVSFTPKTTPAPSGGEAAAGQAANENALTGIFKPAGSEDGTDNNDRLTDDSGLSLDSAGDAVITTASVVGKARAAVVWGAKVVKGIGYVNRFTTVVAPAAAAGPFAPAILVVGLTNAALGTQTGECVATTLALESPWVEQGVGQDASLRQCGSVLVEEISNVAESAVNVAKRVVSWVNPFG